MAHLKKHKHSLFVFLILVLVLVLSVQFRGVFSVLSEKDVLVDYVEGFGVWGPLIFIALITTEVVIPVLPGYIFPLVASIAFGPMLGTLYSVLGNMVGSSTAFWIARRFGRDIVLRFVSAAALEKYEREIREHQVVFWFFYFVPIFPVDIITWALGLSTVKYRKFIFIIAFGFLSNMIILNLWGSTVFDMLVAR